MTFFVGPQKAGTTWIDSYLRWHGGVNLPEHIKETMFFDAFYDKGVEYYEGIFTTNPDQERVEVAPTYFASAEARRRIKVYRPDARIVISVREPVSRTYSSYRHEQRYGFIGKEVSFRTAVEEHHLEKPSRYQEHYDQWVADFGRENVHLVMLAQMKDQDAYVRRLCALLRIPFRPAPASLRKKVNSGGVPRNHLIASLASKANRLLRKAGLLELRRYIVDSPLKQMIYSGGADREEMTEEDRQWLLEHYLRDDWRAFQRTIAAQHEI